jgi:hypothetical protein
VESVFAAKLQQRISVSRKLCRSFTDFSDDLTDFDYDHKGAFLNLVGSY